MTLRERAGAPVTAGFAGKGAEVLSQVLLVTAVPAVLGPADYGEFAVALAVVGVASASMSLGGPAVMTRFVPAASPPQREAVARALVVRLARWRGVQVAVAGVAGTVLAVAAADTFPPLVTALVVVALAFDVAATIAFQAALAFGHAGLWSFRFPLQNVLLAGGAVALYEAWGVTGAVAAIALASAGGLAAGAWRAFPRLRHAPRGGEIPAGALRFGALQAISGLLTQVQQRGGILAVAALNGSRVESGFASLAIGVALTPVYAVRQAFTVQLPALSERARTDPAGAEDQARRLARRTWPLFAVAGLAGALWLDDLLPRLIGEDFRGIGPALGPALALLPLAPLLALAGQTSSLRLRAETRLQATGAGTLAFAVVAVASVPAEGALGATWALLAGSAVTLGVFALRLRGLGAPIDLLAPAVASIAVVALAQMA